MESIYPPLEMSKIALHSRTHIIGSRIHYYPEIDSSNTKISQLADDKAPEGSVVITDFQSAGRGREKRKWISPPNRNLLFSYLLRPPSDLQGIYQITAMAAVACCESIREETGLPVTIKWPNDIRYHKKKLGGILTEMNTKENKIDYMVVGLGINVNMTKDDFPLELQDIATSLQIELNQSVSRESLMIHLLTNLDNYYIQTIKDGIEPILNKWKDYSDMPGQLISVADSNRKWDGYVMNIDTDGGLLIRLNNGTTKKILSGDVEIHT